MQLEAASFPLSWPDFDALTSVELEGLVYSLRYVQAKVAGLLSEAASDGNEARRRYLFALVLHLVYGRQKAEMVLWARLGLPRRAG